jgi:hypothetical protein
MSTLDQFLASYVETALWASMHETGTPLDDSKYSDAELADETRERMRADCLAFMEQTETLISPLSDHVAHDFWLTRNHHGAGFWDGDYPKSLGEELTKISHQFGEYSLYVGDDGKIYGMRG